MKTKLMCAALFGAALCTFPYALTGSAATAPQNCAKNAQGQIARTCAGGEVDTTKVGTGTSGATFWYHAHLHGSTSLAKSGAGTAGGATNTSHSNIGQPAGETPKSKPDTNGKH